MSILQWHKQTLALLLCLSATFCYARGIADSVSVDRAISGPYAEAMHLQSLDDEALSEVSGQALFNISYIAPNDAGNSGTYNNGSGLVLNQSSMGFYRLGLEGVLEANLNIRNLQLGCGGANNVIRANACDIDIKNFSLSGAPDGTQSGTSEGSPAYNSVGRAGTSAVLTNPFIEFAIKNPNSPATREFQGFRVSAESVVGLLSAGLNNGSTPSATDGIQSLSGYMKIAATTGDVDTLATTFGKTASNCNPTTGTPTACQAIGGKVNTLLGARYFKSLPADGTTTGIKVPSLNVGFNLPAFTVTGSRLTQAVATNVSASIPWLPIAAAGACPSAYQADCNAANAQIAGVNFSNDLLYVLLTQNGNTTTWSADCIRLIFCLVDNAKFKMGDGSALTGLKLNITFQQSLSMFHNIPLTGTGFYLSSQKDAIHWPGANADDIAQRGWWMSFDQPVQLGYLQAQTDVDVSNVLPQVASFVTGALLAGDAIDVSGLGDTATALQNNPLVKTLVIPVSGAVATLTLANQQLRSQAVVPNCWGSSSFC